MIKKNQILASFASLCTLLLVACQSTETSSVNKAFASSIHYVEIVTESVDQQCEALEQVHGVSFGPENEDLGMARVAKMVDGSWVGVRLPLADHETPIIRTYFAVDDIHEAIATAEASGAIIAYPPTEQGETGTWAIYILDGIQIGLWHHCRPQ